MRAALLVIGLLLISSQMVSAYTVSPTTIEPNGALVPGTEIIVNFTISNPQSDSNDFPGATDLEMSSQLGKATWSIAILSEGEQRPLPVMQRASVRLSEWDMNDFNRNTVHEQVRVTLSGHAPLVEQTMDKTVFKIIQLDSNDNPIAGSNLTVTRLVINTCDCVPRLTSM